jgi:cytochrome bd-type quinol oxidase subunit 2
MVQSDKTTLLIIIFIVNFLGAVFFCKILFNVLYGVPQSNEQKEDLNFLDIQKKEFVMLNFFIFIIVVLLGLIYLL